MQHHEEKLVNEVKTIIEAYLNKHKEIFSDLCFSRVHELILTDLNFVLNKLIREFHHINVYTNLDKDWISIHILITTSPNTHITYMLFKDLTYMLHNIGNGTSGCFGTNGIQ